MSPTTRQVNKHAKARQRRYRQVQQAAEALQQALDDLGLPEALVAEMALSSCWG